MKRSTTLFNSMIIFSLGIIWALEEVYVGNWLKNVNSIVAGLWISFFVVIIILIGKSLAPFPGSIILLGIIAASLKGLIDGYFREGPIIALCIEALVGEITILILKIRRLGFIITGILVLCVTAFHPFILSGELIGTDYYDTFKHILFSFLAIEFLPAYLVVILFTAVHAFIGILGGVIAGRLSQWIARIQKNL